MEQIKALARDTKEDIDNLRSAGIVPAVVYGPKQEATSIKIDSNEFEKVYKNAGESTIIDLQIGDESHNVLIHVVDRDPVRNTIQHVDFYAIERGKKLTVSVELVFEGVSPAEKQGGVLVKVMHEIEVEAMPRHLPGELKVDISSLTDFDKQIHAKDILLPEGVEIKIDPEEVVALVKPPKEEDVDEPVEGPDMDSIEVESKGQTVT